MNLFREATELLKKKDNGAALTKEDLKLINTAMIPLMVKTNGLFQEDITILEGLEELAKMVGEAGECQKGKEKRGSSKTGSAVTASEPIS